MGETPIEIAASLLEEERLDMISSADLLHRRLGKLIENGREGMGYDFATIISMLTRMRDSVEMYRRAKAVHGALIDAARPDDGRPRATGE